MSNYLGKPIILKGSNGTVHTLMLGNENWIILPTLAGGNIVVEAVDKEGKVFPYGEITEEKPFELSARSTLSFRFTIPANARVELH